jgi:rsbT co-antagonist protein RsbR
MPVPDFSSAFEQQLAAVVDAIVHNLMVKAGGGYQQRRFDELRPGVERAMRLVARDFAEGKTEHFASYWLTTGLERARGGFAIEELLEGLALTNEIIIEQLSPIYVGDGAATQAMVQQVYAIGDRAKAALFSAYTQAREEIIREQTAAIQELSAPLIPIYRGVLVLPLIGVIDSRRAVMIMETLLDGIARREASVVLLDITGVPVVDTSVAHYLLQAARAVRLLGAEVVLVGISPEIAQTIVHLGVNLSDIRTRSDLQAGFAYALELLGLQVTARGKRA